MCEMHRITSKVIELLNFHFYKKYVSEIHFTKKNSLYITKQEVKFACKIIYLKEGGTESFNNLTPRSCGCQVYPGSIGIEARASLQSASGIRRCQAKIEDCLSIVENLLCIIIRQRES